MYFKEIKLKNFRNYIEEDIYFHPKVNIIMGMNAQGKTNLLESLYIMSLGKSFRTNKDNEMIHFNKKFCSAKCLYNKEGKENSIEIIIKRDAKNIKINGLSAEKNSDLLENIYTVIFSPEDLKIIKDEPEKRRRFIDRELCQLKPIYYKNLGRYKKILLQRNTLLKQDKTDEIMIGVWDKVLAEYGSKIIADRKEFIEKLNDISREIHSKITNKKEFLELNYETAIPIQATLEETEELFLESLRKTRTRDLFRGNTGIGPHKDDIKISINDIDARHFGSQGQQRTAALSLKLAEIQLIREEKKEDAILLLDDVLSELDEERQKFLIDTLSGVQLFITAADPGEPLLKHMKEGDIFIVKDGSIEKRFDKGSLFYV
jgi:DNA replication and repair protein RecF